MTAQPAAAGSADSASVRAPVRAADRAADRAAGQAADRAADADAAVVAALFAVDPVGLGGVAVRARAGPRRDAWLERLTRTLPAVMPLRRLPLHVDDERLLGGLDLAATLSAGRPVAGRGLLAEADGGVVVLAMAERLAPATAARIAAALDTGRVVVEREAVSAVRPSRIGVVALDEGIDDERLAAPLLDRLAFHLDLDAATGSRSRLELGRGNVGAGAVAAAGAGAGAGSHPGDDAGRDRARVAAARERLGDVAAPDAAIEALCTSAAALGIASLRAPWLALRAAHAAAAFDGRTEVVERDLVCAARLVLAPRATTLPPATADDAAAAKPAADAEPPAPPAADADAPTSAEPPDSTAPPGQSADADRDAPAESPAAADGPEADDSRSEPPQRSLDDVVLDAARAAIPAGLLAALRAAPVPAASAGAAGSGAAQPAARRGRPIGARRGEPRGGARIDLIETLRAAAPWQALRRREAAAAGAAAKRIHIRRDDFHLTRFQRRAETTTLFVVDASGSAALHRLAEAKGAVELLLADCYVRRDSVAVIAFRGSGAELLLPPTRSLVRAKRGLAGLPGGGGTPLAAGIDAARELAEGVRRRGHSTIVVLLTDGRANIARDGSPGRGRAAADATAAARQLRAAGHTALLLDTSPQPQAAAAELARDMGAAYRPLPHAGAASLSEAVRRAAGSADVGRARATMR